MVISALAVSHGLWIRYRYRLRPTERGSMNMLVLIFDLLSAVGIIAVAYLLYKKFFASPPARDTTRETAYEEGFSDAVRYFGLRKLYGEDPALRNRMEQVFTEAGINHRIDEVLDKGQHKPAGQSPQARTREHPGRSK